MNRAAKKRVMAMDAEREAVVDIAQRMTRPVIVQLRRGLIEAFKDGRKPDKVFAQARKQIENITNEGMLAAHVAATANTARMISKVRGIKLDRTALSPMMDRLKKIADLTGSDLNEIRARYAVRAADTSDDAIAAAQELIGSKAREIAARGLGTRDGVSALREAMDSAGLGTQNPRLLETVYRTEFSVAYNGARLQANEAPEIQEILWGFQYVTVGDDRVRPTHAALDGARFKKGDPKWEIYAPPGGYNCFVPGTLVEGDFIAGLHAEYSGPVVTIETARGHRLTVTANHPVLTSKGWVKASLLCEGDTLFSDTRKVESLDGLNNVNKYDAPAMIEEVVDALREQGSRLVQSSPLDFYGDAKFFESKVGVVGSETNLRRNAHAQSADSVPNLFLELADLSELSFDGPSPLYSFAHRSDSPVACLPCGGTLATNCAGGFFDTLPLDGFRFTSPASLADFGYGSHNSTSATAQFFCDGLDGLAGQVRFVDDIGVHSTGDTAGMCVSAVLAEKINHGHGINLVAISNGGGRLSGIACSENCGDIIRKSFRCGLTANINARVSEKFSQSVELHAAFLHQLTHGGAGLIAADAITKVEHSNYSGIVYDGETINGWILSNGIVSSNCRCSFIEILIGDENATTNPPPKFTNDGGVKVPVVPDEGFRFNPASIGR